MQNQLLSGCSEVLFSHLSIMQQETVKVITLLHYNERFSRK